MRNKMPSTAIVYAANDAYAQIAGISIISLLENNRGNQFSNIYILSDGISERNMAKLNEVVRKYGYELQVVDIREKMSELLSIGVTGYANAIGTGLVIFGRIYIGEIISTDIERVLYLDCDTMIRADLANLIKMDMQDKAVGFGLDCIRNEYKSYIDFPMDRKYYNSGVMLIDMARWRECGCQSKILNHISNIRSSYPLPDQDIMNHALKNDIITILPQYNWLSQYFLYDYQGIKKVYHLQESYWLSEEQYKNARNSIVICHFCGQTFIRPWFKNSKHPMKKEYDIYYDMCCWQQSQATKKWQVLYWVQYVCWKIFPMKVSVWIGALMQKVFISITYGNK